MLVFKEYPMSSSDPGTADLMAFSQDQSCNVDGAHSYLMPKLMYALDRTRNAVIKSLRFTKTLDFIYEKNLPKFQKLVEDVKDRVNKHIKDDLDLLVHSENLYELFNEFEEILAKNEHRRGQKAWRPTDDIDSDLRPHLVAVKLAHRERLRGEVERWSKDVEELHDVIKNERCQISSQLANINTKQSTLSQVVQDVEVASIDEMDSNRRAGDRTGDKNLIPRQYFYP